MTHSPECSIPADRRLKAEILGAVLTYIAARTSEVPYCFLQDEIADQFGVGQDEISLEVMHSLSALAWSGVIEISPRDPAEPHAIFFGARTSIKATGLVRGFTHFDRVPGPDEEAGHDD